MFWAPNFKNRDRNEAIEKSIKFEPHTATRAAAKGRCVGGEAIPLAGGMVKGQKIVSIGRIGRAIRLEFGG